MNTNLDLLLLGYFAYEYIVETQKFYALNMIYQTIRMNNQGIEEIGDRMVILTHWDTPIANCMLLSALGQSCSFVSFFRLASYNQTFSHAKNLTLVVVVRYSSGTESFWHSEDPQTHD